MKLKDFLTLKVGSGILLGSSGYNPYINYTWSQTLAVANKMYSKNTGNSGQNLQLFSGQGVKFNGTNQTIVVPVNATILTEIKRVNGAVVLNTNPQVIANYVIGTGSTSVHTDYFLFTDALTQQEIELYTNNPNKFFQDTRDGIIDNCVLNMPLHGVDKYQVNYSRFSVGTTELVVNGTFDANVTGWTGVDASTNWVNGQIEVSGTASVLTNQKANGNAITVVIGKLYRLDYEITKLGLDNTGFIAYGFTFPSGLTYYYPHFLGKGSVLIKATGTSLRVSLHAGTAVGTVARFDNISIKEISGINEVLNYTADCVTLAKQLPYGSQEANFFHKSSGVPIRTGLSPFFESTPYWGNYGNTGWIPKVTDSFILEFIFSKSTILTYHMSGAMYDSTNRFLFGQDLNSGKARMIVNSKTLILSDAIEDIFLLTIAFTNSNNFKLYMNGVYKGEVIETLSSILPPLLLGMITTVGTYKVDTPIRHFKVITDAKTISTYNALTEYNKLVAKGLLANFVLDENGDYMQDEFGNYIMDI